jgi:YD repeat-containing protein
LAYDAVNRLTAGPTRSARPGRTSTTRRAIARRTTDENGNAVLYGYDQNNRLVTRTDALGKVMS